MKIASIFLLLLTCIQVRSQELYTIQRGETLESIAMRRGVSPSEIRDLNPLIDIYCVGMEIVLPPERETVRSESPYEETITKKKKKNNFFRRLGNAFLDAFASMGESYMQMSNVYTPSSMYGGYSTFVGGTSVMPTSFQPQVPVQGMYGSSVPASWGDGYAGPMLYSSDPILNSTIGMAQTDARLQSQGVNTSYSSSSSTSSKSSSGSSVDTGWYKCCADVANFGIVTYHSCPNCGASHQKGSGHMCKRR